MKRFVERSNPLSNINRTPFVGQQRRERERGREGELIFEIEGFAGRRSCRGGMHTVEFIADESRKEGVEGIPGDWAGN